MVEPANAPHRPVPGALKVVVAFLIVLAVGQLALLLSIATTAADFRHGLLLELILRGLLALLALLVAIQLVIRVPFARAAAVLFLAGFPAVVLLGYVLFPLRWQSAGDLGRLQDYLRAVTFVAMAGLLLTSRVTGYLRAPKPHN